MSDSDESHSCPICIEDYTNTNNSGCNSKSRSGCLPLTALRCKTNYHKVTLSCCNQHLCHKCIYAHINSVLQEGITLQGRTSLSCPFPGCNETLTDECVRRSFTQNRNDDNGGTREQNVFIRQVRRVVYPIAYHILGSALDVSIVMNHLAKCGLNAIRYFFFSLLRNIPNTEKQRRKIKLEKMYDSLIYQKYRLNHSLLKRTQKELDDLRLYEQWSLTIALNTGTGTDTDTHIDNDTGTDTDTDANEKGANLNIDSSIYTDLDYEHVKKKDNQDANQLYTHVTRCPTPNCPCLWLTNRYYYNEKLQNEQKYSSKPKSHQSSTRIKPKQSSAVKIAKMLYKPFKTYFYKPLSPEREEEIMNENGYTNEHWLHHNDIDTFSTAFSSIKSNFGIGTSNALANRISLRNNRADTNVDKDGRVSHCPLCKATFCNLCLHPWHSLHAKTGAFLSHTNERCSTYHKKSMSTSEKDELMTINNAIDARLCPGCGMRTNRLDGCNHMTCPCGYHWCYVCECRFTNQHYACTDANPLITQGSNDEMSCIIS